MKQWFDSLQPRERAILSAGAAVAALIIFWGFVWRPLQTGRVELRASVTEKRQLLSDVYRASAISTDGSVRSAPGVEQSLVLLIAQTSQSIGLTGAITSSRPDGADSINVTVQNAPFDVLTSWLVGLQQNYAVAVEVASLNSTRQPGLVSGQLSLRRN